MQKKPEYWSGELITSLKDDEIFVYGANPEFRNGAGAAKYARKFGALPYGSGRGVLGQTYGLITKNLTRNYFEEATGITYLKSGFKSLSPQQISDNVDELYKWAEYHSRKKFLIAYIADAKNLNGYTPEEMISFFSDNKTIPDNIVFNESFKPFIDKLKTKETFEFFWKTHSTFSQWHPSLFKYKERQFISAEQFMMYSKAKLFGDEVIAKKILNFNNSHLGKSFINGDLTGHEILNNQSHHRTWNAMMKKMKDLGREISNYQEEVWVKKRVPIVSVGSREKYNQNPHLKRDLISKGDAVMVESSPYDDIWGIKLSKEDTRAHDRSQWKGLNLLGQILTDLKSVYLLEISVKKKSKKAIKPG
jgi:ribA/ribD-fused uncharacterized protein